MDSLSIETKLKSALTKLYLNGRINHDSFQLIINLIFALRESALIEPFSDSAAFHGRVVEYYGSGEYYEPEMNLVEDDTLKLKSK